MATPKPGVWGIDLGQCALKALRLELVDGSVKATAYDYIEHAKILSQPDADPDQLVREALTQFLSRNNLLGDMIVISVPGQSGLARFVKLPPVEEKKIADIVKFEAKQQIPFPLEEVVWDFQKINEGMVTDGFAMDSEIGLFAMKRDMVNRALLHFKDVHVEVHVIQMAPLALTNYVAYDLLVKDEASEDGKKNCIVALDIGTDNSNLVITDGAKIIWQRPIPLGGNHFTRALTKDLKLTFAKAEHLKRNAVKSPDLKKILASLKPVLNDFVGEVQRSLGYFTNTHRDANIQYMIGLGNAFRLPGIQKYLQEKLQLEVRKLQTFDKVQGDEVLSAPQFTENIMTFAVPYGLALQGLKKTKLQTNLLPYEVRVERIVRGKKPWAVMAAAALLLMVGGMTLGESMARSALDNPEIKTAMKKAENAKALNAKMDSEAAELKKQIEEAAQAVDRIGAGVKERFQWQMLMQYVDMALPQPDGRNLTKRSEAHSMDVHKAYFTPDAQNAYFKYEQRRFAKDAPMGNAQKAAEDEEFIKKHLVQISIEGINTLYCDDMPGFLRKVHKDANLLRGMRLDEKKLITDGDDKALPERGQVIEIRGYTYNDKGMDFIEKTILENLKEPEQENVNKGKITPLMKAQIRDNLGFFVIYKTERVPDPEPGNFKLIRTSHLKTLIKGDGGGGGGEKGGAQVNMPGAGGMNNPNAGGGKDDKGDKGDAKPNRDGWKPLGEAAALALGEGSSGASAGAFSVVGPMGSGAQAAKPAGNAPAAPPAAANVKLQARYEFVILFIWKDTPAPPAQVAADDKR